MIGCLLAGVITLTAPDGTAVHVITQNIFTVRPAVRGADHPNGRSVLQSVTGPSSQVVKETPEEIVAMLRGKSC